MLERTRGGVVHDCPASLAEPVVAAVAALDSRPLIWVVGENESAHERCRRLQAWLGLMNCGDRPVVRHLRPFEDPFANPELFPSAAADKAGLAAAWLDPGPAPVVVATLSGMAMGLEPPRDLAALAIELTRGMRIRREELVERLSAAGYIFREDAVAPGQAARRGAIVDVFAPGEELPGRMEFEGSRVVSLRRYEPETQKSVATLDSMRFPPMRYFLQYPGLAEYLGDPGSGMPSLDQWLSGCRIITLDRPALEAEHLKLLAHFQRIHEAVASDEVVGEPVCAALRFDLADRPLLDLSPLGSEDGAPPEILPVRESLVEMDSRAVSELKERMRAGVDLAVVSDIPGVRGRLGFLEGPVAFLPHNLPGAVENPHLGRMLLPYRPWTRRRRRETAGAPARRERLLRDIRVGDLVTHIDHGIGRFLGMERLTVSGFDRIRRDSTTTEVMVVEYREGERLYVPVHEADSLRPYSAMEGHAPELDRLGGRTWRAKQNRARRSIIPFARELLDLYARRKAAPGTAFPGDSELEDQLWRRFRFVETVDQKRAIHDVLRDLEAPHPMDRLVCGDVSFGKTEVAVRAAFRVILNQRQVALLCPTTILAAQHFQTFSRRFGDLPVRLEMVSRLVPAARRNRIARDIREGKVDMVIGTHALLSRHLDFPNLGLLMIDEEQRFGVFQKESLKQRHPGVDVLSLSATPIPRTLSFSMAGLQDISLIRTPPLGRLAIRNTVSLFRPDILISAVLNEGERGGQVYIVYNDIQTIDTFRGRLRDWLPEVEVAVIHARMRADVIEKTLMAFVRREVQVLLSTTIIENGIDIPGVNTLVVMRAERFGLTQLYQLRGRIGRGDLRAHAYFLVSDSALSEKANARLQALREFAELGAGYRLAEFDLRLRGAGTLLGNRQHGHIEALGFDYYMELLQRTIRDLKGGQAARAPAELNVRFAFSVETGYIRDQEERVGVYRRVMSAGDGAELEGVRAGVEDRFGRLPGGMAEVFRIAALRLLLKKLPVSAADVYADRVVLTFTMPPENSPPELAGLSLRPLSPTEVEISPSTYADFLATGSGQGAAGGDESA